MRATTQVSSKSRKDALNILEERMNESDDPSFIEKQKGRIEMLNKSLDGALKKLDEISF